MRFTRRVGVTFSTLIARLLGLVPPGIGHQNGHQLPTTGGGCRGEEGTAQAYS